MAQSQVRAVEEQKAGIEWGFVGESWAIATLLSILATIVVGGLMIGVLGVGDSVGAVYIVAIFATLLTYWGVVHRRLPLVQHDQFKNAVAVGVLHFAVALVASIITVVATGASFSDFDGSDVGSADEAMLVLFAFERTGIVAILGCLLAFGTASADEDDLVR